MAIKVPPGQSPPFETIDDKHHAGIIIITAAICLLISLVSLLIRVYVRKFLSPPWGSDDIILLGATITAVAESIIIFHSSSIGFGTDISLVAEKSVNHIQNSLVAADILYLLTIYLSKCCVIAIYLRLTPRQRHKSFLWATFGLSIVGAIISVLVISVDCEGNKPWAIPGVQSIAALDISIEILLFTFCIALIWGLQMHFSHKIVIVASFAARLPLMIFSSLRLSALREYTTTENPTLTAISHTVFTQLQLNYSLIACTAFCLRPFMSALTTNYGTAGDSNLGSSSGGYGERLAAQKKEKVKQVPYQIGRWRLVHPEDNPEQKPPIPYQKRNFANHRLSTHTIKHRQKSDWTGIASTPAYQPQMTPSPQADFLLSLVQFNVYRGLYDNKLTLSRSVDSLLPGHDPVSFDTAFPGVFQIISRAETPSSLALTELQAGIIHAPWIDLIPFRQMRDVLIQQQSHYDHIALLLDILGNVPDLEPLSSSDVFPALQNDPKRYTTLSLENIEEDEDEMTSSRAGFIIWGDPSDENNWEITPGFLRKWSWIMKGSEYLIRSSNKWRAFRGEEPMKQVKFQFENHEI
ncbi:hypothetical protein N7533_009220 [Penicillium manginii]|uniref:uncharacterized protein n=1 Tax=Penicillium manginii TaxID=203109 RepID=UPI0025471B58|nr:uncharacterized protein N7533_009220 [Penicillium manginii]KAJ5744350.1 hypothetical protein N7533_009220 [Penicillium manginii]